MFKDKVKKLFKCMLCASMLLTGFILNPVKANAEDEVGTYANPVQMWQETIPYFVNVGSGITVQVNMKMNLIQRQSDTEMTFNSATATNGNSTSCSIISTVVHDNTTYCSLNSNKYLRVDVKVKGIKNGVSKTKTFTFEFYKNELVDVY